MANDGASLVGSVGTFFGTLGVLISHQVSALLSVILSIPFAVSVFFLGQTIIPAIEDRRLRRNQHRKKIVERAVVPEADRIRGELRDLTEELRSSAPSYFYGSKPFFGEPASPKPSSLHIEWLLQHEHIVSRAYDELKRAQRQFSDTLSEVVEEIQGAVQRVGWKPGTEGRELQPGEVRFPLLAIKLLEFASQNDIERIRSSNEGPNEDRKISFGPFVVARGTRREVDVLVMWAHDSNGYLSEKVDRLRGPQKSLNFARWSLLEELYRIETEEMVMGRCDACPHILRRKRRLWIRRTKAIPPP